MHTINLEEAFQSIETMECSFLKWKTFTLKNRIEILKNVKEKLLNETKKYATAITEDMNKPIAQSMAEVKKCAYLCDYYIENVEAFLAPQQIKTKWNESFVTFEPLGVLLGVMPWNFPFWQVFRFVVPNLLSGNTFVVKHASNVPKSALLLEEIFDSKIIDFPVYKNLFLKSDHIKEVIAHPVIKAVSLTGSENAGRSVAEAAGKNLKKCVLELGGSNGYIVCEDADLELAVTTAVNARMQNAGQSCIAAKRFIIHSSISDSFIKKYKEKVEALHTGDKFDPSTEIGEMAREDLAKELEQQVEKSIEAGAKLITGGKRQGAYYSPTILSDVTEHMPVFKEETFGPVASILTFDNLEDAIAISNRSSFGLGVSVFTKDTESIKTKIPFFNEGAVFINEMVISDPNMPFGGIKNSGYGRELSHFALYEFTNIKSVVIK